MLTEGIDVNDLIFEAEGVEQAGDSPAKLTVLERPNHNLVSLSGLEGARLD